MSNNNNNNNEQMNFIYHAKMSVSDFSFVAFCSDHDRKA